MKKKLLLVLFTLFSFVAVYPQGSVNGAMDRVILEQADQMGKYFVAKDYVSFAKFTHPTVLSLMGGEERMLQAIKDSFGQLEAEGVTFVGLTFTAPTKIAVVADELQCTLGQMIEMKVGGGSMTVSALLVAISRDGGKNWYFADTSGNDLKTMQKMIPNLSNELVFTEIGEPTFIADPQPQPKP